MIRFADAGDYRFVIREERVEDAAPIGGRNDPHHYYRSVDGKSTLNINGEHREFEIGEIEANASILAQRKDPDHYPELYWLGDMFEKMRIYREWSFGRNTIMRIPQMADLPNARLLPDSGNLGLVLNRLRREPEAKERFLKA